MQRDRLLYVDLGATKARIAQGEGGEGGRRILCSLEVPVAGQTSFSALLKRAEQSGALSFPLREVTRCGVGSAGVLVGNVYHQNNFPCPWDIGEAEEVFGWSKRALLLNDTEAQAWCLFDDECIGSAETVVAVPENEVNRNGGAAILAVGTGLGRAGWTREGLSTRHKAGLVRSEHGSVGPAVVDVATVDLTTDLGVPANIHGLVAQFRSIIREREPCHTLIPRNTSKVSTAL